MNALLEAALYWQREGWRVFPCRPDKQPRTLNGFKDAAHTDALVRVLTWREDDLVGGVPGPQYVALDADTYRGADLSTLPDPSDLATRCHETRSGGLHFIWLARPGAKYGNGERPDLGHAFEVRHLDGYLILPSPDSGYRTRRPAVPIAPAPHWLEQPKRAKNPITTNTTTTCGLIPAGGGRHRAFLLHVAGVLTARTTLGPRAIEGALLAAYAEHCEPADLADTAWITAIATDFAERYERPTAEPVLIHPAHQRRALSGRNGAP